MIPTRPGQMTWRSSGQDCALLLRHSPDEPWRPYQDFPDLMKPDPQNMSLGFATFVSLLKSNWETVRIS